MAEVKWIKITTDIFDDDKILLIESLPEKDSLIVIWFKLLCMAGKQNNSGVFTLNDRIAYTDEMLATIFRRPLNTVRLALNTFQQYGMIDIIDGIITIPNWGKHQSLDQLESKREYMRGYMKDYREKQKLLTCKTNSRTNVSRADKEKEIEIDKEKDKKKNNKKEKTAYGEFGNVFLTENEYENLANSFGYELTHKAIKFLDEYIEEKEYKSKSHNLAIRRWVIDAVKKAEPKQSPITAYNRDAINRMLNKDDEPETKELSPEYKAKVEALKNELQGR